jgi:hypothetical protein
MNDNRNMAGIKDDALAKSRNSIQFVIPAKAGIRLFLDALDPGACPGPDPGFAGVTNPEAFCDSIINRLEIVPSCRT